MSVIHTASGKSISIVDPQPEDFTLEDIALGLATESRYSGQLMRNGKPYWYSVGLHSLFCWRHYWEIRRGLGLPDDPRNDLALLLHDASEAYLRDLCTPLKSQLLGYQLIERKFMEAIYTQFNVPLSYLDPATSNHQLVKTFDQSLLYWECHFLCPDNPYYVNFKGTIPEQPSFLSANRFDVKEAIEYTYDTFILAVTNCLKEIQ